ncbi:MAG: LLM class F420-dependent oxidoreductase [Chloroflexota bacterium]|nr:LLM class F420-dependent oxidoreductase [Chloroflexota bacterium]
MNLGLIGVWSGALRRAERSTVLDAAAELEELGFGTIWFPADPHAGLAEHIQNILAHTRRVVVATGPRMVELAGRRSAGTHPYFVPPEHTRLARQTLGPGKVVAPEQMVVLETEPARAREIARRSIDRYLRLPNYTNNLLRLGFEECEFQNGGSDRVVAAIVAHGDAETVMHRVTEHLAAGADHVCIQVLTETPSTIPMHGFRQLATVLPS